MKKSLITDFRNLGIKKGITLLVHSSLKSLGWIEGGADTVILSLKEVLSAEGTLIMPTHSSALSEPSYWKNPPAPEEDWPEIRETMSVFDPCSTLTRNMGIIPENFRKYSEVTRSNHPQVSFAAWGYHTNKITDNHSLSYGLGEGSPLARIYDLNGWVLLLGVGHECNTSLHLAEHRSAYPSKKSFKEGAPLFQNGQREWVEFDELELDEEDFIKIGQDFEKETGLIYHGNVRSSKALLMPQKPLVDYAVTWIENNRS
jgi:aminoglycoside 3-N-acetyltransferase